MRALTWVIGVLATVLLAGGLVLGVVPQALTEAFDYDRGAVPCGSALIPAGVDLSALGSWGESLTQVVVLPGCEPVLRDERIEALTAIGLGALGLVGAAALGRSRKRREAAAHRDAWYRDAWYREAAYRQVAQDEAHRQAARQEAALREAAHREQQWRQGYAPAPGVIAPPPGWHAVDPAAGTVPVRTATTPG
jgi:hypothetical protein